MWVKTEKRAGCGWGICAHFFPEAAENLQAMLDMV
jgi:hypothetical protein